MKKVYTYLAALAAAALVVFSCTPLPEDLSHVDEVVAAPAVTITVSEITDYTATVTIAPDGAANYYAYVIDQSAEAAELDAAKLYSNSYSSVANGLVKYTTSPSTTVELENLKPNKVYQVYAVAGSTTGVVGVIAVESFLTTDKGTPTPASISKKENALAVTFSESITYDATKPVTAYYYAYNAAEIDDTGDAPVLVDNGKMGEAKVDVAVKGATATFTVTLDGTKPLPAGAYFTVGYPAGAFVDAVGNPCPARTHVTGLTSKGELGFGGFYGHVSTKAFELEFDEEREIVLPSEYRLDFAVPEGVTLFDYTEGANATMIVAKSSATRETTTTYTLELDYDWGYSPTTNAMYIWFPDDVDIEGGDIVTYGIDAGSIEDIYGNTNAALSQTYLYSYGYSLDEFYGTYTYNGIWYKNGTFETEGVVIAPREPFDDPDDEAYYKDRNVAIYGLFKNNPSAETLTSFESFDTVHYGTFNVHTGVLDVEWEFEGVGTLDAYSWENYVIIFSTDYDNYQFFQAEAGTLTQAVDLRVYLNNLGTWGWYDAGSTLVKTSDEYTIPDSGIAQAASRKASAKKDVKIVRKDFVTK